MKNFWKIFEIFEKKFQKKKFFLKKNYFFLKFFFWNFFFEIFFFEIFFLKFFFWNFFFFWLINNLQPTISTSSHQSSLQRLCLRCIRMFANKMNITEMTITSSRRNVHMVCLLVICISEIHAIIVNWACVPIFKKIHKLLIPFANNFCSNI